MRDGPEVGLAACVHFGLDHEEEVVPVGEIVEEEADGGKAEDERCDGRVRYRCRRVKGCAGSISGGQANKSLRTYDGHVGKFRVHRPPAYALHLHVAVIFVPRRLAEDHRVEKVGEEIGIIEDIVCRRSSTLKYEI